MCRVKHGLSRVGKLKTSQQNISRLESPSYEGHSLSMLRRVADVLGATVRVTLAPKGETEPMILSESKISYRIKKQKG